MTSRSADSGKTSDGQAWAQAAVASNNRPAEKEPEPRSVAQGIEFRVLDRCSALVNDGATPTAAGVLDVLGELVPLTGALIAYRIEESAKFRVEGTWGGWAPGIGDTLTGDLAATHEQLVAESRPVYMPPLPGGLGQEILSVPIFNGDKVIGLVQVATPTFQPFLDEHLDVVSALSRWIAGVVPLDGDCLLG